MLRRASTLAPTLVLIAALAAVPATILAQDRLSLGSITGRTIDAAGRGIDAQRVELLYGGQVVSASQTNAFGAWSFDNVKPGEYVVRMVVRGRVAGARVYVGSGQSVGGTLIVVPTASISPQLGTLASLIASVGPTVGATVAATAVAAVVETETTQLNEVILTAILNDLTAEERTTFAAAVLAVVASQPAGSTSPFAQYTQQFTTIVNTGGAVVPTFPPPVPVS